MPTDAQQARFSLAGPALHRLAGSALCPVLRFRAKFVEPLQPFKPCQLPQPFEDLA